MNYFEVKGSAKIGAPRDENGHAFRLEKNGWKIFGGCWADCVSFALLVGEDEDIFTCGTAESAVNRVMKEYREEHFALRKQILGY